MLGLDESAGFAATGVADARKVQQDLASLCTTEMEPPIRAVINLHEVDGATLVVAEIPELPREQKPCYYKGAGLTHGAYVRTADGDYQLTPYEVQLMIASRGQPTDDVHPVEDATPADLDDDAIAAFLSRVRTRGSSRLVGASDDELLRQERVLVPSRVDGAGRWVPSLAGLLVFGRHPQAFAPRLLVTVTVFPGRKPGELGPSGERILDDVRCEGPIPVMLQDALRALHRNLRHPRTISGIHGHTGAEYPDEAIREAIVNALGHRDLSPQARGTPVQVQLFADRLDVMNPGGLFGPVTVERLGVDWVSSARNQLLMRLLEDAVIPGTRATVAEGRGTGVSAMIEAVRTAGRSPPRFDDRIGTFRVTFPRHALLDGDTVAWLADLERAGVATGLTESQRMALALMRTGEAMTNARYRQVSGIDSRDATAELRELVQRGLAAVRSTGRWTQYVLGTSTHTAAPPLVVATQTAAPRARPLATTPRRIVRPSARDADAGGQARRTRADRRPEIRRLLLHTSPLSRAEIAGRLGLESDAISKWLTRMTRDGELDRVARSPRDPATTYRLTPAGRARTGD